MEKMTLNEAREEVGRLIRDQTEAMVEIHETEPDNAPKGGRKLDKGKPRYDLIPPEVWKKLAILYGIGAEKYGDRNWEEGINFNRVFRAAIGHALDWWDGEELDQTDGQHHLDSAIWGLVALRHYLLNPLRYEHLDNRPSNGGSNTFSRLSVKMHGDGVGIQLGANESGAKKLENT